MLVAAAAFVIGCDAGDNVVVPIEEVGKDVVAEVAADLAEPETSVLPETTADEAATEIVFEAVPDGQLPECDPGEGCFLDNCDENIQCQSGWCVEHMGEGVCSRICQDECPAGWSCQQVAGTFPDVVYICVSKHSNLCKPCAAPADCKAVGGADDVCVDYGDEGSFCGGGCGEAESGEEEECPWGFSCKEIETVDRVVLNQCVADAGVCPCTATSVALGLWTPCEQSNEFGTCPGKRVCGDAGLSQCDAQVPAHEECNGIDDDCDEEVDEPYDMTVDPPVSICDDDNDCTDDSCAGGEGCQHDVLSEGECIDGDACSVGDHCEDGVCVGLPVVCDDGNPCTDDSCDGLGGCINDPNKLDCDDEDPCTVADQCENGECTGYQVPCDCYETADCAFLDDGDLCNGTLVCDTEAVPYECVVDPETVSECAMPQGKDAICQQAFCDPNTGDCSIIPDHEGFACDDGDACSVGDKCVDGACQAGVPAVCSDANPCTEDSCDPDTGCVYADNSAECSDGDVCTTGDQCDGGQCVPGVPMECDDGNPCTDDSCDQKLGCVHAANDADCDDGNDCTMGDHCADGQCVISGNLNCNDSNACTNDICQPDGGCVYENVETGCNDGDPCTADDQCEEGQCVPGPAVNCDDGNSCTADACADSGLCEHLAQEGNCDDGNDCTTGDHCEAGTCAYTGLTVCDDDNICTTDACNPASGCVFTLNDVPCDDDDLCTTGDHCHLGECISASDLLCDDGNPCTDDACSPVTGCTFVPNNEPCSDGSECSVADQCSQGWCLPGGPPDCSDGNLCTDDECDPVLGCVNPNNSEPCDDGNECTVDDVCGDGQCKGGGFLDCDDGNVCTNDSCDEMAGCKHTNNSVDCEDGNACTTGDVCVAGVCTTGPGTLECADDNACTDDGCNPDVGCIFVNNGDPCEDGDVCTDNDLCSGGSCKSGGPKVCPDDGNTCTIEKCEVPGGCTADILLNCCGNGIKEGGEDCDDGNQVNGDGCNADCLANGVWAFGEFRPALKCGDFKYNGDDYRQYCFGLKGNTYCTGNNKGAKHNCENLADGIRLSYDYNASWPMRFTKNTATCQNYHPDHIKNFSLAIGYGNYNVEQTKTGNSCQRTWLDADGNFKTTGGNSGQHQIYKIRYWN